MAKTRRTVEEFLAGGGDQKESRNYLITDYAYVIFKKVAATKRLGIGSYMEQLADQQAREYLSSAEIEDAKRLATQETNDRRERRLEKAGLLEEYNQQQREMQAP